MVVVALVVFFSLTSDAFMSLRNFTAIAGQASTLLVACLGATFVVLMGSIDLSVGAVALLSAAVSVLALNEFPLGAAAVLVGVVAWRRARAHQRPRVCVRPHPVIRRDAGIDVRVLRHCAPASRRARH